MKCLACNTPSSDSLPVAPWEALAVDIGNGYQVLQDVYGGFPGGRCWQVQQRPPLSFEDDVDSGPLGGTVDGSGNDHHRVLKMTSMVGPLGGTAGRIGGVQYRG
jgi:hypothetical protein